MIGTEVSAFDWVALDRATDLVLLQATNLAQLGYTGFSVFQAIRLSEQDCTPNLQIFTLRLPN